MRKGLIVSLCSVVLLIVLIFSGIYYYQATHFNANVSLNNINVGGLTADQALTKLKSAENKNIVYVGDHQIYDGKDTKIGFSDQDLSEVQNTLRKQQTLFPSSNEQRFILKPNHPNSVTSQMEKQLKEKLQFMNTSLKAPKDAKVRLVQGKMVVSESVNGTQYDVNRLLQEYEKQADVSEVHLKPVYKQPLTANSPIIKQETSQLQDLLDRTVDYELQNKPYAFKGSDLIKRASVSKSGKTTMSIDTDAIKKKLEDLNRTQSTLHKSYPFKTHSGNNISVKGESYGWAINVDKEATRIKNAFEKGEKSINAYNIYGEGWSTIGVGYHNPTNNGIGNTYVEISIKDQRMWVYKNGKLAVTTRVVTGTPIYNEDTPKGVWYIEYKQSPSILRGSEVGMVNYAVHVDYWAPFTLGGCGLHDASWRTNWATDAYIAHGSGGCVNTPPSMMKQVYENVVQNEPVVVY